MKSTIDSKNTLDPGLKEQKVGNKPKTERESIHWEIKVADFRITSPKDRKLHEPGLESMIELYSEEETMVGTLKFYRGAGSLPANCLSMGCVCGHYHESQFQHFVDILRTMEDLRLYYLGKLAEGGRTYLQPSEESLARSATEDEN